MSTKRASTKRALILSGDGINCENETRTACEKAGFAAEIRHLNDLIAEKLSQETLEQNFSLLVLPGGFSFGDELGSGRVLALKIRHGLGWDLERFAEKGGLILGVCNGFQALIRLGVFGSTLSITHNDHGRFLNTWVTLEITGEAKRSPWFTELPGGDTHFPLPIRHGEGRILSEDAELSGIALRYTQDVNGSQDRAAALLSKNGRILGLMPHPEAFVRATQHPAWTRESDSRKEGLGLQLFKNAFTGVDV